MVSQYLWTGAFSSISSKTWRNIQWWWFDACRRVERGRRHGWTDNIVRSAKYFMQPTSCFTQSVYSFVNDQNLVDMNVVLLIFLITSCQFSLSTYWKTYRVIQMFTMLTTPLLIHSYSQVSVSNDVVAIRIRLFPVLWHVDLVTYVTKCLVLYPVEDHNSFIFLVLLCFLSFFSNCSSKNNATNIASSRYGHTLEMLGSKCL